MSTGPGTPLDLANEMARGTLMERMGIAFVEVGPDRLVATMPVEGNTQPYGLLHGGASVVHAGPGRVAVGIDINATHHRAARRGVVTGTATPLHLGGTTASWHIAVTDEDGRPVCTARITCLLRDAAPGA